MKLKLGLFFLSFLVSVLIVEFILQAFNLPKEESRIVLSPQFQLVKDSSYGYVNKISSKIDFKYPSNPNDYFNDQNIVSANTNTLGFRGKDVEIVKKEDTLRILILGDSFTFGEGVTDKQTYSVRLEEILGAALKKNVEVMNWGVGGYNLVQQVDLMLEKGIYYNPDIVILAITFNDIEPALFSINESGDLVRNQRNIFLNEQSTKNLQLPLGVSSNLINLLWKTFSESVKTEQTIAIYKKLYLDDNPLFKIWRQGVVDFKIACSASEIKCYSFVFPMLWNLNKYPFLKEHQVILKWLDNQKVESIDGLELLKSIEDQNLWVHNVDHHPSAMVHQLVAESISSKILSEKHPQQSK